jgi:hypothetical protein
LADNRAPALHEKAMEEGGLQFAVVLNLIDKNHGKPRADGIEHLGAAVEQFASPDEHVVEAVISFCS